MGFELVVGSIFPICQTLTHKILRQHHISQLLRIVLMRREANGSERHSFIIWFVCVIDTYALLSASGSDGEFVSTIVKSDLLPTPEECLAPIGPNKLTFYPNEEGFFSSVLQFNQKIVVLAATLGQLAKELREQAVSQRFADHDTAALDEMYFLERQNRIFEMQETFRAA